MVRVGVDELWADDTGGPGPPVVLLHPGIADSTIWDGVLPALAAQYRVIRYDVRGYGRSPPGDDRVRPARRPARGAR